MTGIFEFLARLTDLVSFIWKRKAAKNDDPVNKTVEWRNQAQKNTATDNEEAENIRIADALARYRMRKYADNKRGQATPPAENK